VSDLTEDELRVAVMKVDLLLKRKQAFWETPRHLAIIGGTAAAILAAVFGVLGYKLGSQPPSPIVVQLQQPLSVKVLP
jgi:hypothetical protein